MERLNLLEMNFLRELAKLGEGTMWQLASGGLLAVVALLLIMAVKVCVALLEYAKESFFIVFIVERHTEVHSWLAHFLAKSQSKDGGVRKQLYDPQHDYDSDDGDTYYSDDEEVADSDEELLQFAPSDASATAPGGAAQQAPGILLEAKGGRSKRLLSRIIPGERQVLMSPNGGTLWVQRIAAPPKEEDSNGRNKNHHRESEEDRKGAFRCTVRRSGGEETFGSLIAAAKEGYMSSRRGRLNVCEAVAVNDNTADQHDADWDDDGFVDIGAGLSAGALGGGCSARAVTLGWRAAPSVRAVAMSQVIFPPGHGGAEALLTDVSTFLDSASWYAQRGIPYRRGYVIHGPAGCGKTMLTAAVATALQLSVYIVDLSSPLLSDESLATLLGQAPHRTMFVLERIDRAFDAKRQRVVDKRGGRRGLSGALTFSGLLNALDGVCAFEGSLTVFTSEAPPHTLDQALMRPGRCDFEVAVPQASPESAALLFSRFYRTHPRFASSAAGLEHMAEAFAEALRSRSEGTRPFSMRDIVSFLCTRSPAEAVRDVDAVGIDAAEAAARSLRERRGSAVVACTTT